jgi:hypothetical protein
LLILPEDSFPQTSVPANISITDAIVKAVFIELRRFKRRLTLLSCEAKGMAEDGPTIKSAAGC